MSRVDGLGGDFIKAKDPVALRAWYREHPGINIEEWGGMAFNWSKPDGPGYKGTTIFSAFKASANTRDEYIDKKSGYYELITKESMEWADKSPQRTRTGSAAEF